MTGNKMCDFEIRLWFLLIMTGGGHGKRPPRQQAIAASPCLIELLHSPSSCFILTLLHRIPAESPLRTMSRVPP